MLGTIEPIFIKIEVKLKGAHIYYKFLIYFKKQYAACGVKFWFSIWIMAAPFKFLLPHRQCPQNNLELARASDASSVTPPVQRIPPGTTFHSLRGWPTSQSSFQQASISCLCSGTYVPRRGAGHTDFTVLAQTGPAKICLNNKRDKRLSKQTGARVYPPRMMNGSPAKKPSQKVGSISWPGDNLSPFCPVAAGSGGLLLSKAGPDYARGEFGREFGCGLILRRRKDTSPGSTEQLPTHCSLFALSKRLYSQAETWLLVTCASAWWQWQFRTLIKIYIVSSVIF